MFCNSYRSDITKKFQAGRVHGIAVALGVLEKTDDAVDDLVSYQHSIEVVVILAHAGSEEF